MTPEQFQVFLARWKERRSVLAGEAARELIEYVGQERWPRMATDSDPTQIWAGVLTDPGLMSGMNVETAPASTPGRKAITVTISGRTPVTCEDDNTHEAFCMALRDALREVNTERRQAREREMYTY